ncbi:MAG TPA: hypothetical protein VNY31_08000 [Solirubrobacteraceae bacterium]|nr:hypothetical protein [Solirubrobacteraceae bacterium]
MLSLLAAATNPGEYGETGTTCEPKATLDRLLEALMEPVGRQARRPAAESVRGIRR